MRINAILLTGLITIGGCGGSGGGSVILTEFESLLPFENTALGTIFCFEVNKVKERTGLPPAEWTEDRYFKLDVIRDPTGPNIWVVERSDQAGNGFGVQWAVRRTADFIEFMFSNRHTVTANDFTFDEFDIDMVSPGARVAGNDMEAGDTFENDHPLGVDYSLEWVGTDAVDGFSEAQRFDVELEIPHPSDTVTVTGSVWVVKDRGPVRIEVVKVTERTGFTKTETYTATLEETISPN